MELIEKYVQRIQRRYKIPRDNLAISASNYPPYNPAKGQLWYNTADSDLYMGAVFKEVGSDQTRGGIHRRWT